jgi:hypothetical protein
MNRLMAGGVAGALAAVGVVALAVPGLAQEEPEFEWFQGETTSDPQEPVAGQEVTVSDDSCFEGTTDIYWLLHPSGTFEAIESGQEALNADGSWDVTLTAPDEPGDYLFFGLCMPPGATQPDTEDIEIITAHMADNPPVELFEEWGVESLRFYHSLVPVVSAETPPTNPPNTNPPNTNPPGTTPTGPTTPPAGGHHGPTPPPTAQPAAPVPGRPDFTG